MCIASVDDHQKYHRHNRDDHHFRPRKPYQQHYQRTFIINLMLHFVAASPHACGGGKLGFVPSSAPSQWKEYRLGGRCVASRIGEACRPPPHRHRALASSLGTKRSRTLHQVARRAVVEKNGPTAQGPDAGLEDARGRITDGDDEEGDESALDSKHKGGSLLETERALRDGLAAWEELGEGLTGVLYQAQRGFQGLLSLQAVPDTWLQLELPELPTLPEMPPFALPWPPESTGNKAPSTAKKASKSGRNNKKPSRRGSDRKLVSAAGTTESSSRIPTQLSDGLQNVGEQKRTMAKIGRLGRWRRRAGLFGRRQTTAVLQGLRARLPGVLGVGGPRRDGGGGSSTLEEIEEKIEAGLRATASSSSAGPGAARVRFSNAANPDSVASASTSAAAASAAATNKKQARSPSLFEADIAAKKLPLPGKPPKSASASTPADGGEVERDPLSPSAQPSAATTRPEPTESTRGTSSASSHSRRSKLQQDSPSWHQQAAAAGERREVPAGSGPSAPPAKGAPARATSKTSASPVVGDSKPMPNRSSSSSSFSVDPSLSGGVDPNVAGPDKRMSSDESSSSRPPSSSPPTEKPPPKAPTKASSRKSAVKVTPDTSPMTAPVARAADEFEQQSAIGNGEVGQALSAEGSSTERKDSMVTPVAETHATQETTAGSPPPPNFIPKIVPPPNAWWILSNKAGAPAARQEETPSAKTPATATTTATPPPLEQAPSQPQSSQQQTSRTPAASPTSPATPAAATPTISAVAADGDGDGDGEDGFLADEDIDEDHAFGDVLLSVQSIKSPPEMEITVNRRSGTPAAAAKVAAESENVLEEWVGEGPMNSSESHRQQQGFRTKKSPRRPRPPSDLVGHNAEMRLVEMACLAGLSSGAGKSAGLIMQEELGFDTLLRGLRADVRPRLRRVVLQAISTIIDNDPSLAATLLGIDPENPPTEPPPPPDVINNSNHDIRWKTTTAAAAAAASGASDSSSTAQGVGRRVSPAAAASGGVDNGLGSRVRRQLRKRAAAVRIGNEIVSDAVDGSGDDVGPTKDLLLDRITDILGLHPVGTGFGVGGEEGKSARAGTEASAATAGADVGGGGPAHRALRAVVDLLPRPAVRPSSLPSAVVSASVRTPAAFVRAAAAASAATGRAIAAAGGGQDGNSDSAAGDEEDGRNWWKDEVAVLEDEGSEHESVNAATGTTGWGRWWGRGRVSRERLVGEALELLFRLVMSGDVALTALRAHAPLVAALRKVADGGGQRLLYDDKGMLRRVGPPLTHSQQVANKILAALGAHKWVPKTIGQKGLRILCFDGGGTRGVLSLAMLKHVEKALGGRQPHEVFDMIVGTSTGGIIAALAGFMAYPLSQCQELYDSLVHKIFVKHPTGGMKLALTQAFYDEVGWMNILKGILGDRLLIDLAADPLRPLVSCPSTLISSNPAKVMLWRSYNYPVGHQTSRYYGSFRHMVRQAVRATTAAPIFFPPLMINGALYSDGALLCNNPSAVAHHEATRAYPGVPVEMIVSLGTGCFYEEKQKFMEPQVGWGGIINQVIASATETEITTDIVADMLPPDKFYRFNPRMTDMPIDEVRKERLEFLKSLADEYFETPENQDRLQEMAARLLPPL